MANQIYHGFDKFNDFDKLKAEEEKKQAFFRAPDECYRLFGADLDKCSTQQNEGCERCRLFRKDGE